jgi:hypothetical protein
VAGGVFFFDQYLLWKAVEGVQRVAHRALVRVQTRNDDEA